LTPRLSVHGRITNLFDEDYEEAFGFPSPGRGGFAGVRVAFGQ
jgi:vitamin B12 transporter